MSKAKKLMAQMYGIPYKGASSATLLLIKRWREKHKNKLKKRKKKLEKVIEIYQSQHY